MPNITLAEIVEAADRKYGPFVVTLPDGDVTLLNPLRMSKDKRRKLEALQADTEGDDGNKREAALYAIVTLAAKSKADGDRLLKAVGDDLGQLAIVLNQWGEASQQGEA